VSSTEGKGLREGAVSSTEGAVSGPSDPLSLMEKIKSKGVCFNSAISIPKQQTMSKWPHVGSIKVMIDHIIMNSLYH